MAANFVKKIFRQGHSTEENDSVREEEEGGIRSTRFADTAEPSTSPSAKKKGKKEVRVQEPASEDGEQHKAKATSVKKSADKKGPPSVSFRIRQVRNLKYNVCRCRLF